MTMITKLKQKDVIRLDPDRLTELFVELGEDGAEETICSAMEELAVRLADIYEVYLIAETSLLQQAARSVSELAAHIGLSSLSRVALDVEYCLHFNDPAAISATMARMIRIGQRSLTTVWDHQDISL